MGYRVPLSSYFVDAKALSIFERADEILALKVIAHRHGLTQIELCVWQLALRSQRSLRLFLRLICASDLREWRHLAWGPRDEHRPLS
jgi:hypothetical protein